MKTGIVKSGRSQHPLLSGVLLFDVQAANAQTSAPPGATATRPARYQNIENNPMHSSHRMPATEKTT